jgi:YD repeat-containing protein
VDFSGQRRVFVVDGAGDLVETRIEGHPETSRTFGYENHLLRTQTDGRRAAAYAYGADGLATRVELNGETWRDVTASDAGRVLNDRPWSPGQPPLAIDVAQSFDSPRGGFPATAQVTDDRGVTREYAFWGDSASTGWRPTAPAAPEDLSFDVEVPRDGAKITDGYDPLVTDHWPFSRGAATWRTTRRHDAAGNVVEETDTDGPLVTNVYDDRCQRPTERSTAEFRETWQYDVACRLILHEAYYLRPTGPTGTEWKRVDHAEYRYGGPAGLLTEEWDDLGLLASYEHDAQGRLTRVMRRDGTTRRLEYDDADRVTRETEAGWDGRERWTERSYDDLGRLRFVIGPTGQTEYQYDDTGGGGCCGSHAVGPRFVIDPDLNVTEYLHDDLGRVEWVIDEATGTRTRYRYDGLGSLVAAAELRDAAGSLVRETTFAHDWNGRLQAVVQPPASPGETAGTTGYGYLDPTGHESRPDAAVTSVSDAEGRRSDYEWGGASGTSFAPELVASAGLPDSGRDRYGYTSAGLLAQQDRADGATWRWIYDDAGRVSGITYGPSGFVRPTWYVTLAYTDRGDLDTVRELDGWPDAGVERGRTQFGFDDDHRLFSERRTQAGRTYETNYEYDSLGDIKYVVYPSGLRIQYAHKDPGRGYPITSVEEVSPAATVLARAISYTSGGLLTGYETGGGMEYVLTRGPRGRIERVQFGAVGDPTPDVLDLDYAYDDLSGNILGITDVVDPDRTAGYAHDALDRLVGADGWWGTLDWSYDKTGNRLSETRDGTASTYSYEPGTSRLATVTGGDAHVLAYDASGNATRYDDLCLDYDAADRLVALRRLVDPTGCGADRTGACSTCATTLVQENSYDWKFRRVKRLEHVDEAGVPLATPACTAFVYDLYDRLVAEHDCSEGSSSSPAANVVAEYVYLEGYHVLAVRRGGSWSWYANDHLPTPRKLVDASGAVVWDGRMEPFGTTDDSGSTVEQPLRFPGQVGDAGGPIVANGVRFQAPAIGRLLSVEPAVAEPGLTSSVASIVAVRPAVAAGIQSRASRLDAYSYAANEPVAHWDFQGRWPMGYPAPNYDSVRDTYACAADWIGSFLDCIRRPPQLVGGGLVVGSWLACKYFCPRGAVDPTSAAVAFACWFLCAQVLWPSEYLAKLCKAHANERWQCEWGLQ